MHTHNTYQEVNVKETIENWEHELEKKRGS